MLQYVYSYASLPKVIINRQKMGMISTYERTAKEAAAAAVAAEVPAAGGNRPCAVDEP